MEQKEEQICTTDEKRICTGARAESKVKFSGRKGKGEGSGESSRQAKRGTGKVSQAAPCSFDGDWPRSLPDWCSTSFRLTRSTAAESRENGAGPWTAGKSNNCR